MKTINPHVCCWLLSFMALNSASANAEPSLPPIVIGGNGVYERGSLSRQKEQWFGLFCSSQNCWMSEAKLSIGPSTEEGAGGIENTEVVYVAGNPLFLLNRIAFNIGEVTTWFRESGESPEMEPPYKALKKHGTFEINFGKRKMTLSWVKVDAGQQGIKYRYHISDGTRKQFLFSTDAYSHFDTDTSTPHIHWVGDLDRDGVLDFVLSLHSDCSYDARLYLSSTAKSDELVHKSAQFIRGIPACGC